MAFRPKIDIYFYRDRIRVANQFTGHMLERVASIPFSTGRMLVADTASAARLLHEAIVELEGRRRLLAWPTAIVHPMELCEDGLSPVEKQAITAMLEQLGFARTEFAV